MNLKRVKEILETLSLSAEQETALDKFFTQYTEEVRKSERKKSGINSNEELIPKAIAEKAFNAYKEDSEKAFNAIKDDSKKAFAKFKADSEIAFDLYAEDLQNEYTESTIQSIQDLYSDIEERVKNDFMESKDFQVLESVKKMVTPLIAVGDQSALLEEIESIKQERDKMVSVNEGISKENTINDLISGFPKEYTEEIKGYLNKATNEDEIYERFSFICEMLNKGALKDKNIISEDVDDVKSKEKSPKKSKSNLKSKRKKVITEEFDKGKSTVKSKTKTKAQQKDLVHEYFTEEDDALIGMIFG